MHRPGSLATLAALAALLYGCAHNAPSPSPDNDTPTAQTEPDTASSVSQDAVGDPIRLFKVTYPLLRAAYDFCKGSQGYATGLYALNRFGMGRYADLAWTYGIGNEVKVLYTAPDGPAYKAGIRSGDIVLSINGERAPSDARSTAVFGVRMALLARTGLPVEFSLRRGSRAVKATVQPEPICGFSAQVSSEPRVDAVADGKNRISISRGMMRFAKTDADLALVVAHEIAHNAMRHMRMKAQLLRSSVDARASNATPARLNPIQARALETDADYLGLYIMARAGLPLDDAPAFLERMAAASLARGGNPYPASHPPSKQRLTALHKAIKEISRKRAAGAPLVPELRALKTAQPGASNG